MSDYCDLEGEYSPIVDVEATPTALIIDLEGEYGVTDVIGDFDPSYIEVEGSI